ncbi:MAG: hypothetical protein AB1665_01375 [Candidatus Thermoplasmatota archaeon]
MGMDRSVHLDIICRDPPAREILETDSTALVITVLLVATITSLALLMLRKRLR